MQEQYYYYPQNNNYNEARALYLKKKKQKSELLKASFCFGTAIVAFLIIQTIISLFLNQTNLYDLYRTDFLFNNAVGIFTSFLSIAVPFGITALINKKKYRRPVVPLKHISFADFVKWVCFGMLLAVLSSICVSYIVTFFEAFGISLTEGTTSDLLPDSIFAGIIEVFAIAVMPAICEEFAMRCCTLQLLRNYGKGFAVFSVSVIFGLLHGNIVQFLFAFLIGLIAAYITIKCENILPAMFIHGLNNLMSVIKDIAKAANNGDDANITVYFYMMWFIAGIVSLFILLISGKMESKKESNDCLLTSGEKFIAFIPGMIIPFAFLIYMTALTIKIS